MSIELVMLFTHLILCRPLLLLPSVFLSIKLFSSESALHIRWPKYWSFSISPFNEHSGLISFRIYWIDLLAARDSRVFSNTAVQKHQFFGTQPSLRSNSHIHWRRKRQPTPVFLPGKSHGQRSLVGYSPWGHKDLDMTE